MRRSLLAAGSLALLAAQGEAQTVTDGRLRVATWCSGLSAPTTFTWIGPGEMFVIQKGDGKVRWVKDGTILGTVLDLNVNNASERGGLGIAADPGFATNHYVYVYYSLSTKSSDTAGSSEWVDNRVERYEWNGSALVNVFGPLVAFPMISSGDGPNHDGGVIRFGPDGKLYGVTGDLNRGRFGGGNERVEQNTAKSGSASVGGVFRINPDGTIPADNPFTGETDTAFHLWWSYGLRNSFGLTFDPLTGSMWDTENGPNLYDEVNLVPKGMNSGWLKIMGPDTRDAKYGENNNTKFDASDLTYLQNSIYVEPILSFKTPVGITAITFLSTKRFPRDLWDDCVFGDNNNGSLYFMDVKASRADFRLPAGLTDRVVDTSGERNRIVWGSSWNVPADAQIGADGYLYVASLGGNKIVRVRPVADEVQPIEWGYAPGTRPSGDPADADASDDAWYTLRDSAAPAVYAPLRVGARFRLNEANPTAITLQLEDHYGRDGIIQIVDAYNFATSTWDQLDARRVGDSDTAITVAIANPAQYVDPATLDFKLGISGFRPRFGGRHGLGPQRLSISFDLLRLDVTYP